nr:MAG TPA: hypothetical protein [Caudoviricetes sp.]
MIGYKHDPARSGVYSVDSRMHNNPIMIIITSRT